MSQSTGPVEPTPPGGSRYENPSLERYSDLRFAETERRGHRRWVVLLFGALALIPLLVIGVMVAIYTEARSDEAREVDAIIVMGAAQYNGRPSEVLAARLDHALTLYEQGYASLIIVTGGNQPGDVYTEAGVGDVYLQDRGVPPEAIVIEDESSDTWASMRNVARKVEGRGVEAVLIVSDGFHLFRSERMASAVGFDAWSSPVPDSPIEAWSGTEFSYVVRETGAIILQAPRWLF